MNDGDQALQFIYLIGVLVLVGSAFAVRRVPLRSGIRMAAVWALLFLAVFAAFALKDDFVDLGRRLLSAGRGEAAVVERGGEVRIARADDGHFWVDGTIDGVAARFLIDSGATTTGITSALAARAGIVPDSSFPVLVDTANGTIAVASGKANRIVVGPIARNDMTVYVSDRFGGTNVLGMNFLSSLSRWGVEGRWLVLKP